MTITQTIREALKEEQRQASANAALTAWLVRREFGGKGSFFDYCKAIGLVESEKAQAQELTPEEKKEQKKANSDIALAKAAKIIQLDKRRKR